MRAAERFSDNLALNLARVTLGVALVHRQPIEERDRGARLLAQVSEQLLHKEFVLWELPIANVYRAREKARGGDRDGAIPLMRDAVDQLVQEGQLVSWGVPATGVLVETLLDRNADGDVAQAAAAIRRLAEAPSDDELAARDIWSVRLRALLQRAHGDTVAYRHLRDQYRAMAKSVCFGGHIAWAEAMP